MKMLIVDDEPLILMDLEFAAEDAGIESVSATNIARAIELIENAQPDCAILDVSLLNGETCLPIARTLDEQGVPYVIHSGDLDRQNERIRSLDVPRIAKPCSADAVVQRALKHCREMHDRAQPTAAE